ncbi:MAG: hypothetical protein H6721_12330 [Sandaracinus sp.]|nr:hypothetical protein [Sandaracinus sp.]
MGKWIVLVCLVACVSEPASVVPVTCNGSEIVCDGEAVCEGDLEAYVACGRDGAYCRKFEGYVDGPVDLAPVCVQGPSS